MKRVLMMLATVGLTACSFDTTGPGSDTPSDPATETFASSLGINLASMQKTANGAYYKDAIVGVGNPLVGVRTVVITYTGFLKDGTVFASGQTQTVAMADLPHGLQEAMPGMRTGGQRVIVMPSALGYGASQVGVVPPNSTLIFDVKLEQIP